MRDEDGCVVAEGGKKSSRQKGLKKNQSELAHQTRRKVEYLKDLTLFCRVYHQKA